MMRCKGFLLPLLVLAVVSLGMALANPVQAAYSTFNNPNYYYTAIKAPAAGTYYSAAGFSPDGTKIVAQKRIGTWREIVLMNADGSNETVITAGDSGGAAVYGYLNPFWSDDGKVVGFVRVNNTTANDVMVYDLQTTNTTIIYTPSGYEDCANPDFLGNSHTKIVFWQGVPAFVPPTTPPGPADLFTWDGATLTNITNTADYKEYEPVSDATGNKIVYWSGETVAEPTDTTHTLTYSGGTWTKDVGFTPIVGSFWSYWTTPAATQIATSMTTTGGEVVDLYIYDNTGAFVADLTGPGYTGGTGQYSYFGSMPQGPNGEFVLTSNAGRSGALGRDLIIAAPRSEMYVSKTGSDSNPGTEAAPFVTIQKAINESVASGTVNVAAGTYNEQITIPKALTINGSDGAVLDGTGLVPTWTTGVQIKSGNVTFNNVDVTKFTQDGIICGYEASTPGNLPNIHITNCKVSDIQPGNWGFGIYFGYEGEAWGTPKLMTHLDYSGLLVEGNEIVNTACSGLVLQSITASSGKLVVRNNNIHGITTNDAIWIEGARNVLIENNTIADNLWGIDIMGPTGEPWYTIDGSYGPKDITIQGNEIKNNTGDGIAVYNGWPSTIAINWNDIEGNMPGVGNYLTATINAEYNWWGDASGPYNAASNPTGTGDDVSDYVDYYPWLFAAYASETGMVVSFEGAGVQYYDGVSEWTLLCGVDAQNIVMDGALYGSFTDYGVYKYDGTGYSWSQLCGIPAASMVAEGGELYGSFTGYGVYKYDGTGYSWSRLSDRNAVAMKAVGGNLYASFEDGLYEYVDGSWKGPIESHNVIKMLGMFNN